MAAFRTGYVYVERCYAGQISKAEDGYRFVYDEDYLSREDARAVSLTLPMQREAYGSNTLFPFFDELIPEDYPTYLYNVPQTGNTMSPSVTARIANAHPNVLGYKDSTQNIAGLQELMAQVKNPDFQYIAGSDSMTLPMMALGGVGVISAISVPFPKVVLDITERFFAGDMQGALDAHRFSMKVRRLLKTATDMNGYYYACELLDMPFHGTRMPKNMTEMTEDQKRIIRTGLEEMKLI